ncbi:MAG: hypothetical protein A2091_00545 [Desulfuromonadales bacterium GWD2_61_12]|nr:MAG: hypothetical protein A2005_06880 [Desulfuromonadales bacterium GWC2_61_20]OGR34791.1 MAG: hypothetical protein A2091_00545 [Desulfuromonadales bacterium GWD2_61_12]HAD04661.1 hypothetical protein [Desulfuromonas sp.]HBT83667.1 hypothetical protein [Desulfuromonas sp.]
MILAMTTSAVIFAGAQALPSRGSSDAARYVSQQTESGLNHLKDSHAFGVPINELWEVFANCRAANWDGYQAEPVEYPTLQMATQFLKALPLGTAAPSIGAEPDGHLTMEWYRSPRRTLSVSISPEGELHYASLHGASRVYGTEPFFGDTPESIMDLIKRVVTA